MIDKKNVREMMHEKGITQQQLAKRLRLSKWHLNRVLNGSKRPSRSMCSNLAGILGVTVEQLWGLTGEGELWQDAERAGEGASERAGEGIPGEGRVVCQLSVWGPFIG